MGARERVRLAIEAPTAEAAKMLNELQDAADVERLTILINGWFRGFAGALEELAISIDTLERRHQQTNGPGQTSDDHGRETTASAAHPAEHEPNTASNEDELTETALTQRAAKSRAETAALSDDSTTMPADAAPPQSPSKEPNPHGERRS